MSQRPLTDNDVAEGKKAVDWKFWFAPFLFTGGCLICLAVASALGDVAPVLSFVCGLLATYLWIIRLRESKRLSRDLENRTVEIYDGSFDRVSMRRFDFGICYVHIAASRIRVPNDRYKDLQEAGHALIEYLPESGIAVNVKPAYGLKVR